MELFTRFNATITPSYIWGSIFKDAVFAVVLYLMILIFKDISREYTPFCKKHTNRLKIAAILMAVQTFIPPLSAVGPRIVFAVLFYCVALIFDYGRQLQEQSDETL